MTDGCPDVGGCVRRSSEQGGNDVIDMYLDRLGARAVVVFQASEGVDPDSSIRVLCVGQETLDQVVERSLTCNFAVDLVGAILGELLKRVESSLHRQDDID